MDAKLNTINYEEKQIIDKTHPPVLVGVTFAADQGTLNRGLLVATATAAPDLYVPFAPAASDGTQNVKGVLTTSVNTTGEAKVATVLKHGTAVEENLHVSGTAPSSADLTALRDFTIHPL